VHYRARRSRFLNSALLSIALASGPSAVQAQLAGNVDQNLSRNPGDEQECAISRDPANPLQMFAFCNTSGPGLLAVRSKDGGSSWFYADRSDKTIADGDPNQGPEACCDPSAAWDSFGNLFLTYIDKTNSEIVVILSIDGGATFSTLRSFEGSVDQPTIVAAATSAADAPVAVWIVWNQDGQMVASGARVTGRGLGSVGHFGDPQTIPGTAECSFGDVAIAPSGAVVQVCQSPTGGEGPATILVNTDSDGLGPGNFSEPVRVIETNVGGFDFIPAQNSKSVDAEAGLAFDNKPGSLHRGRLYLVYTDEKENELHDTDITLKFSDDDGRSWSAPIRVNDDSSSRSQFLPKIAVDDSSGKVSVCWLDCRNSANNTGVELFCTTASPADAAPQFLANVVISDGSSTSPGFGYEFGDYSGLAYRNGEAHPIWPSFSNVRQNDPDRNEEFEVLADRVTEGEKKKTDRITKGSKKPRPVGRRRPKPP
jgi:hypothetical protein